MKIFIYTISLLLLFFLSFCLFMLIAIEGFGPMALLMALPALVLMVLLKIYKDGPKANFIKSLIFLVWFILIVVSVGFYVLLAQVNWR